MGDEADPSKDPDSGDEVGPGGVADPGGEASGDGSEASAPGAGAGESGGKDRNAGAESHEPAGGAGAGGKNEGGGEGTGPAGGAGAGGKNEGGGEGAGSAGPAEMLGQLRAIRRRARLARHAYWFPLVVFGLLTSASVPFYIPSFPARGFASYSRLPGPAFLQSGYLGGYGPWSDRGTAYYWLGAMLLGIAATVFWYRWRGNRVGLRTPARGYLITGLIIIALAVLIPLAAGGDGRFLIMPGDLVVRGTFPFVLIGFGLCFLAWAERSVGLAVIAAAYLALALLASLYDVEHVFYNWFGWYLNGTASALPNVLLPALVLLLSGAGAWVVQRRQHAPGTEN